EALAGSMVKISGKDVLATWKIIVAGLATPALYGIYSMLYFVFLVLRRPQLSTSSKLARVGLSWLVQPILHYMMMRLGDTGWDIYKSIKPLLLAIRNPEVGSLLRDMRLALAKDITAFVNAHAQDLLPAKHTSNDDTSAPEKQPSPVVPSPSPLLDKLNDSPSAPSPIQVSG
ncbi:hypothetical protein DM01DRAFT_1280387, partial [Hesseltinella vesiculosa]